ncbi:U1 small nuclear ribonucleoprotein 70 kDa isoform X1 [Patagioenas fasciata]|uniref:U1 small nuclear ribonucleoprotein 70 kDa isoform X1 n=1 Tax=Patagioenas fasciata TaxID=372321 RepID=UPI003A9A40EA
MAMLPRPPPLLWRPGRGLRVATGTLSPPLPPPAAEGSSARPQAPPHWGSAPSRSEFRLPPPSRGGACAEARAARARPERAAGARAPGGRPHDDAVPAPQPPGALRPPGPHPLPAPPGEAAPREAPQPALQRHRALHPRVRGPPRCAPPNPRGDAGGANGAEAPGEDRAAAAGGGVRAQVVGSPQRPQRPGRRFQDPFCGQSELRHNGVEAATRIRGLRPHQADLYGVQQALGEAARLRVHRVRARAGHALHLCDGFCHCWLAAVLVLPPPTPSMPPTSTRTGRKSTGGGCWWTWSAGARSRAGGHGASGAVWGAPGAAEPTSTSGTRAGTTPRDTTSATASASATATGASAPPATATGGAPAPATGAGARAAARRTSASASAPAAATAAAKSASASAAPAPASASATASARRRTRRERSRRSRPRSWAGGAAGARSPAAPTRWGRRRRTGSGGGTGSASGGGSGSASGSTSGSGGAGSGAGRSGPRGRAPRRGSPWGAGAGSPPPRCFCSPIRAPTATWAGRTAT